MSLFSLEWWQIALLFLPALLNLWGIWHAVLGGVAYVLFGWRRAH